MRSAARNTAGSMGPFFQLQSQAARSRNLVQLIVQDERVLGTVPDRGTAIAPESAQIPGRRARDDGIGLLRLAALEYPCALQYKSAGLAIDSSGESLEPDEARRAVAAVHHEVLNLPFPLEITGESLGDAGPCKFWEVRALAVRLFIPALDGEPSIRALLHVTLSPKSLPRMCPSQGNPRTDKVISTNHDREQRDSWWGLLASIRKTPRGDNKNEQRTGTACSRVEQENWQACDADPIPIIEAKTDLAR